MKTNPDTTMDKKLDRILEKLEGMESKLNDLWKFNNMDTNIEYSRLLQSKSPLSLTTLGKTILKEYKGDVAIDLAKSVLIEDIKIRGFKSPLDVQDFSRKLILSKFNSDDFIEVKDKIYHTPTWENHAISVSTMSFVMGLYLRDMYLEKYPMKGAENKK